MKSLLKIAGVLIALITQTSSADNIDKLKAFDNIFVDGVAGQTLQLNSDSLVVIRSLLRHRSEIVGLFPDDLPLQYLIVSTSQDFSEGAAIFRYNLGFGPQVPAETVPVTSINFEQKFTRAAYNQPAEETWVYVDREDEEIESHYYKSRVTITKPEIYEAVVTTCDPNIQGMMFRCPKQSAFLQLRTDVLTIARRFLMEYETFHLDQLLQVTHFIKDISVTVTADKRSIKITADEDKGTQPQKIQQLTVHLVKQKSNDGTETEVVQTEGPTDISTPAAQPAQAPTTNTQTTPAGTTAQAPARTTQSRSSCQSGASGEVLLLLTSIGIIAGSRRRFPSA